MTLLYESYVRMRARQLASGKQVTVEEELGRASRQRLARYDIFLSQTIRDAEIVLGVYDLLTSAGYIVFCDWIAAPKVDHELQVTDDILCGMQQMKQSRLLVHYADEGKRYVVVQQTSAHYSGVTLQGIALGATQEKVLAAYGLPKQSIALPEGTVWVYPEANLFFRFDAQSTVSSWAVYQTSGL